MPPAGGDVRRLEGYMQITVEVDESKIADLVRERIEELFSLDTRYRETGVREMVRKIVDDAAVNAVSQAEKSIEADLPAMAAEAVRRETENEIGLAAKRGMRALQKLYAGFDPKKLTPEQRAWLESQIANAAKNKETK